MTNTALEKFGPEFSSEAIELACTYTEAQSDSQEEWEALSDFKTLCDDAGVIFGSEDEMLDLIEKISEEN